MINISIFFSEDVRWIEFAANMLNVNNLGMDVFSRRFSPDLNVPQAFGGHIVWPLNGWGIIIVDLEGLLIYDVVVQIEVSENIYELLQPFCAPTDCTYLRICGAACCVGLSFGYLVYRTVPSDNMTGNWSCFEKVKEDWIIRWFWHWLVLGAPICISEVN